MTKVDNTEVIQRKERDWMSMISISHDFFHRWRRVVEERFGTEEARALVERFWESVGEGTAENYLQRGKDTTDLELIVNSFVKASLVMGESARAVKDGSDILLIHDSCPWIDSFKDYGAPGQCQAGCDKWFETALRKISQDFVVKTDSCLSAGDNNCVRRYSRKNR